LTTLNRTEPFRRCPRCAELWPSRAEFLGDPSTVVTGYQVHFEDLELGLFLFNHTGCETTFAVQAHAFADLYNGPIYRESKTHTEECKTLCLHEEQLDRCPTHCECAWVREVLLIVANWSS
jgi:hypothetical protein